MKTKLLISLVMFFFLACTNEKPLLDSEKQIIISEVKEVNAKIIKAAENLDLNVIRNLSYDTTNFSFLMPNGKSVTYSEWIGYINEFFSRVKDQTITTIAENYRVIDKSTVLYTNVSKTLVNFKDSSIIQQNPWTTVVLYKNIDDSWKWVDMNEYGHEEIISPSPLPKDLNQIELAKQALGHWRSEYGDTIVMYDQQPFGNAQVVSVKTTVKGKPYSENRQLLSYDRVHDRLTLSVAGKSGWGTVFSIKFNTPTTYTAIPYNNVSNPAYAPYRVEAEFTDPDTYIEKEIVNNEAIRTVTTKRVK